MFLAFLTFLSFSLNEDTYIDENYENLTYRPFNVSVGEWTFIRCKFCHVLTPEEDGAAIFISTQEIVKLSVSDCSFNQCKSRQGIIYGFAHSPGNVSIAIVKSTFTECVTEQSGGMAVETYNIGSTICLSVTETNVIDCKAGYGGGISCESWEPGTDIVVKVQKCEFTATAGSGGGIYSYGHEEAGLIAISVQESSFINCTAEEDGGAIGCKAEALQKCLDISGCNFVNCKSGRNGGGIYCSSTSFKEVRDCTFDGTTATTGGTGGGIWCEYGNVTMVRIGMQDCSGTDGGGFVSLADCDSIMTECCFTVTTYVSGLSGIVLLTSSDSFVSHLKVSGCRARCDSDSEFITKTGMAEVNLDVEYQTNDLDCFSSSSDSSKFKKTMVIIVSSAFGVVVVVGVVMVAVFWKRPDIMHEDDHTSLRTTLSRR